LTKDPRWHRYLLGVDPLSGRVRQYLLNEAISSRDANRVAAFFRGFQIQHGGGASTPAATSTSTRQRSSRSAPDGKQIYTREMIADLYSRHRRGEFANREAAWNKIEQDLFDAQKEGRISMSDYITK
jgi:hypothetical protein